MNALVFLAEEPKVQVPSLVLAILIGGGLACIVVAILGSVPQIIKIGVVQTEGAIIKLKNWQKITLWILGVVLLPLGIILAVAPERFLAICCTPPTPTPPPTPIPFTIASPKDGSSVSIPPSREITVHGTAPTNMPPGKELWLLVENGIIQGYFPQSDANNPTPIVVSSTGQWNQFAFLGTKDDPNGTEYILHLVLVDKNSKGQAAIERFFREGRAAGYHYTPIYPPLPDGIQLVAEATVKSA